MTKILVETLDNKNKVIITKNMGVFSQAKMKKYKDKFASEKIKLEINQTIRIHKCEHDSDGNATKACEILQRFKKEMN